MKSIIIFLIFSILIVGHISAQGSCGRTGRWTPCQSHCQANCKDRRGVKACTRQCEPGCLCNPGYIRLSRSDGRCVRLKDCSRYRS